MKYALIAMFLVLACNTPKPEPEQAAGVSAVPPVPVGHAVTFKNQCNEKIWVGSVGNEGFAGLSDGGWEMDQGATKEMVVPVTWSGRVWPRTGCTFKADGTCPTLGAPCCASGSCLQADNKNFGLKCGYSGTPPASLIEVTLDAPSGNGPYDVYDTSFVDGWSVPVKIEPVAGTFNPTADPGITAPWCTTSGCTAKPTCPSGYEVPGSPESCFSPCQVAIRAGSADAGKLCCSCNLKTACTCPDSCCAGQFGCTPYHTPAYPADMTCNPWNTDVSRAWDSTALSYISTIKAACPQVYAWQFDDFAATFNCRKTAGLVAYKITFCP